MSDISIESAVLLFEFLFYVNGLRVRMRIRAKLGLITNRILFRYLEKGSVKKMRIRGNNSKSVGLQFYFKKIQNSG